MQVSKNYVYKTKDIMEKTIEIVNNKSKKECIDILIHDLMSDEDIYTIEIIDKRIHKPIMQIKKNYGNGKYQCTQVS